jgi:hypothetical protein
VGKALAGSTALELPAKAAALVAKASAADKQDVAATVVKVAVGVNPAAAAAIVSAVSRESPAAAPVAAVNATTLQRKQVGQIAKAAAAAAPAEAAKIVAALIKEFPQDYGVIAVAADEGAPLAGRDILAVVADCVPALQSSIRGATTNFAANVGNVPVQAILSQSYNQALTSGAAISTQIPPTLLSQSHSPSVIAAGAATGSTATRFTAARPLGPPVVGNPFLPIVGPPFGTPSSTGVSVNYATPVSGPRTPN